jgi:pimeloyl-ACP methyl ester carboxylesterase
VDSGFATAPDGGVPLYWESTAGGTGTPVLLIHGLGLSGGAWWRTVDALSPTMRVITFDHRGIGRSESATPAYTTEAMADDAACILDELGLDAVHIYGISLGGMVAQQLALRHPQRIRSLILGATQPGGRRAVRADAEVLEFFRTRLRMRDEEAAWASAEYNYGPRCRAEHPDRIAEDIERRLEQPFNVQAYRAQMFAAVLHNCYGRLDRIEVPTLVVHGAHDRVVPVENAYLMAERLPDCRLTVLEDSGHLYPTEAPETDETIGDFFGECDGAGALPASSGPD